MTGAAVAGTVATVANPPSMVVMIANVGYGMPNQPSPKGGGAPVAAPTVTTWASLGLSNAGSVEYTARDVFSQELLPSNVNGFVAKVTSFNATLVLVSSSEHNSV